MKRFVALLLAVALSVVVLQGVGEARKSPGRHYTRSYTRKDGTHVSGYYSGSGPTVSRSHGGGYSSSGYSGGGYSSSDAGYQAAPTGNAYTNAQAQYQPPLATNNSSDVSVSVDTNSASPSTMPTTGGEPILLALFGATMALGALALRRRICT
jgi:hypothetical protein